MYMKIKEHITGLLGLSGVVLLAVESTTINGQITVMLVGGGLILLAALWNLVAERALLVAERALLVAGWLLALAVNGLAQAALSAGWMLWRASGRR